MDRDRRLTLLLCLTTFSYGSILGAFPTLLPEIAASAHLSGWELGAVASAFGFARMLVDIPVGFLVARAPARALLLAPVLLAGGVVCVALGGSFPVLVMGRVLTGTGHAVALMSALTAVLRSGTAAGRGFALNALEFSTMLGILAGAGALGVMPARVPWSVAFLVACSPVLVGLGLAPVVARVLPESSTPSSSTTVRSANREMRGGALVVMAFIIGCAAAAAYASLDQVVIPFRASREFQQDRAGVASLLIALQVSDLAALLPVGALADRGSLTRVLGGVLLVSTLGIGLVTFGSLPVMAAGCAIFGLGMAGWMLPLGVLRRVTPADRIAWQTSLYRVAVDTGQFAGVFVSGVLAERLLMVVPVVIMLILGSVGLLLALGGFARRRFRTPLTG